jgi:hypothetical protein
MPIPVSIAKEAAVWRITSSRPRSAGRSYITACYVLFEGCPDGLLMRIHKARE